MTRLNRKGITLVELMIYLGLAGVMLVLLSELFISILDESVATQNYSAVQTDGRYIMARLRYEITIADAVLIPADLGSSSMELITLTGSDQHHYYLTEGRLYLNDGTGDYLVSQLDTIVSGLSFVRQGNVGGKPIISLQFTSSSGVAG
ncbi:prepilin-type N-terminal cleavage/methylation domain-containing protein, partial [Patescibacteria group bacterium]|nr:prepilin-type N-terminal cleavage/methylation domain-containing protein [Patescibacteria group bacterium]MBU1970449.1 prepilin-type N-terminal cleavage/methylation domain-containing protein [Patescibacteria group bacterium]